MIKSFSKGRASMEGSKDKLIGMKRDELLKGVTVEIGKQDFKLMEAERAFGKGRSSVAKSALNEILRIQNAH